MKINNKTNKTQIKRAINQYIKDNEYIKGSYEYEKTLKWFLEELLKASQPK